MKKVIAVITLVILTTIGFAQESAIQTILSAVRQSDSSRMSQVYETGQMTTMLSGPNFLLLDYREDSVLRVYIDKHPEGFLDTVSSWNMEIGTYVPYSISNYLEVKLTPEDMKLLVSVIDIMFSGNCSDELEGTSLFTGTYVPEHQREFSAIAPSEFQSFLQNNITLVEKEDFLLTSRLEEEWAERSAAGFNKSPLLRYGIYINVYDIVKVMGDGVDHVEEINIQYKSACQEMAEMIK